MSEAAGLIAADWFAGYDLGTGVSSFDGHSRGFSIDGKSERRVPTQGADVQLVVHLATSKEEFYNTLGISAEVSGSYGLGSVSAKMEFARSFSSSKFSSWLVARAAKTHMYTELNDPVLSSSAQNLLKDAGPLKFFQTYGDLFVSEMESGGEFLAVLEIISTSVESQESVRQQWDQSYTGGISVATKGEINSLIKTTRTTSSKMFQCWQHGGDATRLSETKELDIDHMVDYAIAFPGSVDQEHAMPVKVFLQDYRALPIKEPLSAPEIDRARRYLAVIANYLNDLETARARLSGILEHPELYKEPLSALNRYQHPLSGVKSQILALKDNAEQCIESFMEEDEPVVPDIPHKPNTDFSEPSLNPDQAYIILSALGAKPWVIAHDSPSKSAPHLILRSYSEADASQRWILHDNGDETYQLVAGDTKMPVSIQADPSPIDPSIRPLRLTRSSSETAASWIAQLAGEGSTCPIIGNKGEDAFEVAHGMAQDRTAVCLAPKSNAARQQWAFLPVGMQAPVLHPPNITGKGGYTGVDPHNTGYEPVVVAFKDQYHLFYKDPTGSAIFHASSKDGENWTQPYNTGIDTSSGPCPVVFNNELHLFYQDSSGYAIYHQISSDGFQFRPAGPNWGYVGMDCSGRPSAAVLNDQLCLVFRDRAEGTGIMYVVGTLTAST